MPDCGLQLLSTSALGSHMIAFVSFGIFDEGRLSAFLGVTVVTMEQPQLCFGCSRLKY